MNQTTYILSAVLLLCLHRNESPCLSSHLLKLFQTGKKLACLTDTVRKIFS